MENIILFSACRGCFELNPNYLRFLWRSWKIDEKCAEYKSHIGMSYGICKSCFEVLEANELDDIWEIIHCSYFCISVTACNPNPNPNTNPNPKGNSICGFYHRNVKILRTFAQTPQNAEYTKWYSTNLLTHRICFFATTLFMWDILNKYFPIFQSLHFQSTSLRVANVYKTRC